VPVLAGAIEFEFRDGVSNYYNSSILYMPDGTVNGTYRKMHLVPFGEFIPGEGLIPSLAKLAPLGFSCTRGEKMTVFECGVNKVPFSVLICFEDVFPNISRLAAKKGARFLVNQTNDAWFDGSSASVQHLANAVFRCVENRVSMVRCANTGVTCFIDQLGRMDWVTQAMLEKTGRATPLEGNRMDAVRVAKNHKETIYTRYGDFTFALPCALGTIVVFALAVFGAYRKNRRVSIGGNRQ
jgi:apolipoprotein N-acyltransferase